MASFNDPGCIKHSWKSDDFCSCVINKIKYRNDAKLCPLAGQKNVLARIPISSTLEYGRRSRPLALIHVHAKDASTVAYSLAGLGNPDQLLMYSGNEGVHRMDLIEAAIPALALWEHNNPCPCSKYQYIMGNILDTLEPLAMKEKACSAAYRIYAETFLGRKEPNVKQAATVCWRCDETDLIPDLKVK